MIQPSEPILTNLLGVKLAAESKKPTAMGTRLRYSNAGGCARSASYYALGARESDPEDDGDAWAPGVGNIIHDAMQAVIKKVFPSTIFESASKIEDIDVSGSADGISLTSEILSITGIDLEGTHVMWELKTMGEFPFDKQAGWNRMKVMLKDPQGPTVKAVMQAGINALGQEDMHPDWRFETVLMGSVCVSALSKSKSKRMGVEGFSRYGAEYRIPRSMWEPLAKMELRRMAAIEDGLDHGFIADRIALDDFGTPVFLHPGRDWNCDYCSFRGLCEMDGEGEISISDSAIEVDKENNNVD